MLIEILEQVLNGLLAGAYYLLIALGLTLIFSRAWSISRTGILCAGRYFVVKLADTIGFVALRWSRRQRSRCSTVVERFLPKRHREDPALGPLMTFVWRWSPSRR
jgi:branched-chain amino acid transport system permease protein